MRGIASLFAVAAILALVAGCGNEEQNDYVDEVNALQTELVSQVTEATSGSVPTTPEEAAEVAGELAQVFADGAEEFEAVSPPEEVADLHAQLVEQIRGIADQVEAAEEAFNSGNAQEASQAALELQQAGNEAQTALDDLISQINDELQN
jgi:Family of unknown function (DUF6376)